jgi:hypothetical protein
MLALKPQDIPVVLKLLTYREKRPPLSQIAVELELSPSQIHHSLRRLEAARLVHSAALNHAPNLRALGEFLVHGVKYAFPPERGEMTRGVPTAHAAKPLRDRVVQSDEPPPVWPWSEGPERGMSFQPFYATMPGAALRDPQLYEMLALVDAIRDGRARERGMAEQELIRRIEALGA